MWFEASFFCEGVLTAELLYSIAKVNKIWSHNVIANIAVEHVVTRGVGTCRPATRLLRVCGWRHCLRIRFCSERKLQERLGVLIVPQSCMNRLPFKHT